MNEKLAILVPIVFFLIPISATAVDLSGRVQTDNDIPVCALVLASGRSVFSCNPSGPFRLNGLRTEPDGTINLQVYAKGFQPYFRTLTEFGYQTVVMTRAGSSPVDDGLSDMSSLAGSYVLLRVSAIFNDGMIIDTADASVGATGTMTIESSGRVVQTLNVTIDGASVTVFASGWILHDGGYYLVMDDDASPVDTEFVLTERGRKLITFANTTPYGGYSSEENQWRKVAGAKSAKALVQTQSFGVGMPVTLGAALSELLQFSGMKE